MYDSYSSQVDDDGTPGAAASIAGEAIRDLNHRTFAGRSRHLAGWEYPSDAYRVLGSLGYLAGRLPQALDQIDRFLVQLQDAGCVGIDRGTEWEDNPAGAIEAATLALRAARQAAVTLYTSINAAQQAVGTANYCGPGRHDLADRRLMCAEQEIDRFGKSLGPEVE
jgi:hypothetical protein